MIRTFASAMLLLGLAAPSSHAGLAQPSEQPEPQKTTPQVYTLAAGGRSYLGVDIRDVDKDRAAALKLKEERGVEVTMVDADAPAGKAGIHEHDVIVEFNNTPVESEEQLRRLIRETPPGRTVVLGISRDGTPMKISAQLAEHSKVVSDSIQIFNAQRLRDLSDLPNRMDVPALTIYSTNLGMQTENLTRQLGDFFGVKNGEGVLVRNVTKGSAAEKAGLKAGDVIVRVGDEKLSDRGDLARILRKHREGGKVSIGIMRDKKEQTLTVDVPQRGAKDSSLIDESVFEQLETELAGLEVEPELLAGAGALARSRELSRLADKLQNGADKGLLNYDWQIKGLDNQMKTLEQLLEKFPKAWDKRHNML